MKIAYTMAEVIVTIGIIGVVAALTIPTVVNKVDDAHFKTAYKKVYRDLNEAYKSIYLENEELYEIKCSSDEGVCYDPIFGENFKLLSKYFNPIKTCFDNNKEQCWVCENGQVASMTSSAPNYYGCNKKFKQYAFIDNSGREFIMYNNDESLLYVDTNGMKGPNHIGKDRWGFLLPTPRKSETNNGLIIPRSASDITKKERHCPSGDCKYYTWLYK